MPEILNSPEARDIAFHLHPYTDGKAHMERGPLIIERGEGVHVFDNGGRRYMEAMSGLWSVAVGFSEPRLVQAATRQMEQLPFYHSFTHKSHGPVIDLAEKLVSMAPVPMSKAFFTNSGSEANDTAMKLIWYRSNALGQPQRKKIIARHRAYHGVTIGSASLTGLAANHISFDLPIAGILRTGSQHHAAEALPGEDEATFSARRARELEDLILAEGPETIAAFFAEPVQGAGGVIPAPQGYWSAIQAVLRKYDILLVADEVICGFGRTGRMFGSETYGIEPDIMVLSKALSASYVPIAALLVNARVADPIIELSGRNGVLGHGFTGSGHPVAAAVALETIRIIEERELVAHAADVGAHMLHQLSLLSGLPAVSAVRGVGLMAAVELAGARLRAGTLGRIAGEMMQDEGVIVRTIGDAIAFCPPLIVTHAQVDWLVQRFAAVLERIAPLLPPE